MSSLNDQLGDQLNLRWAWEKVRRMATPGDNWFDEVDLAAFDLELDRNLESIADEFKSGQFRITPLRPLPFPKEPGKKHEPRVRQLFQVAVRDQVAWAAVVNVIGPHVDVRMPTWSYGNRLYRTIWVEDCVDGRKRRRFGQYRHASGQLYLPFGQSWPIFRRHVYLTTRAMAFETDSAPQNLDEMAEQELDIQMLLEEEHRCPFVFSAYWANRRPPSAGKELFWCSIDLQKFYPSLNLNLIRENITAQLPGGWRIQADRLLDSMLRFELNLDGWRSGELRQMGLTGLIC